MKKKTAIGWVACLMLAIMMLAGCGSSIEGSSGNIRLTSASKEYPNANLLVTADSVEANLDNDGLIIIDARGAADYAASHLPGAINLIHNNFWTWGTGLKAVAELQTLLGEAGLTRNKTYVIYDNTSASWGAAGRIFWMLEYLGCRNVHIMNGGWDKWIADGRVVEAKINTLPAATFTAAIRDAVRSTKESIANLRTNANFAVIDARTDEEFIGWQLYGEARGGHIPGAIQIPYAWFYNTDKTVLSYADLKTLFESRGITRDKTVTSHCTVGIRSGFVYFALRLMGYANASNYDASIVEWAAADETTYPMEKMPNHQLLVNADWVKSLIAGGNPQSYPGLGYRIIEASSSKGADNKTDYLAGHIPGAQYLNIYRLEGGFPGYPYTQPSDGNLLPDVQLLTFIGNMGITTDTTVVIYSRTKGASQPFRAAWALLYAGVKDVRILNGGLDAWTAGGGTLEQTENIPAAVAFGLAAPAHPEYVVSTADVQTMRVDPASVLGDMRTWSEYIGESNPYLHNGFTAKGRIPGGVWIHEPAWYFDSDATLRSYTEVAQMWQDAGVTAAKQIAFYCGTGWRSSLGFILAYLMGFPNASNYDSGFYGWSYDYNNPQNPIDTGTP